jgi:hypothetical protein
MSNIHKIIENTANQYRQRNWNKLYWAIDLHDTVITGTYNKFNQGATLYPNAKYVLDHLYNHPVHQTILWTSSYNSSINDILIRLNLKFNYINCNPEVSNNELCDFSNKFYFNILLDDKAGFNGISDWIDIHNALNLQNMWFYKKDSN